MSTMNLKEAFRFQNKLQSLLTACEDIISRDSNVTLKKETHLRSRVMKDAEDETTVDVRASEYADNINKVLTFMMFLLDEKVKLSKAIRKAKDSMGLDMDAEVSLNTTRRKLSEQFNRLAELRASEVVLSNAGTGYRFNAEGNQVSYRCDLKRVITINYDRNQVRRYISKLNKDADRISAEIDKVMVNAEVDYAVPFDVNESFANIFEAFNPVEQ